MTRPLACAALLFSVAAWAQDAGKADAGVAPPKPHPVFAIGKGSPVLEQWAKSKPEARAALPTLKTVKIGERAYFGIFLEGWELPASRKVDLSADILITDCNKRQVLEKANVAATKMMDPRVHVVVPLLPAVELMYGLTDPECAYSVKLTIFDLVRGTSWTSEGSFTVAR